jgi:hypothetical protein
MEYLSAKDAIGCQAIRRRFSLASRSSRCGNRGSDQTSRSNTGRGKTWCELAGDSEAKETPPTGNRARNGNFATGDQGSKLPYFREQRSGLFRAELKTPPIAGLSRQSLQNAKTPDWVVEIVGLIEPVSNPAPGTEILNAETARRNRPICPKF